MAKFLGQEVTKFPYGPITALPLTLATLAMIFSYVAAFSCTFVTADGGFFVIKAGFWGVQDVGSCTSYANLSIAATNLVKAARFVGFVIGFGSIFSLGVVVLTSFIEVPINLKRSAWIVMFVIVGFSVILFPLAFNDNGLCSKTPSQKCGVGAAGVLNVLAILLWIGCAVSLIKLPSPNQAGCCGDSVVAQSHSTANSKAKDVQIEIKENPDGSRTKTTTTTTVDANGSKITTTKVENIAKIEPTISDDENDVNHQMSVMEA